MNTLKEIFISALPGALVALLTLCLTWLVGQSLTFSWNLRQKRKEFELSALNQLYTLYGEFFSIWKLWNSFKKSNDLSNHSKTAIPKEVYWQLYERTLAMEGGVESILVKLTAERTLSQSSIENLGKFRQAFQILRETIRDDQPLEWSASHHPEYLAFKQLNTYVASMLSSSKYYKRPYPKQAYNALKTITANKWEGCMVDLPSETIEKIRMSHSKGLDCWQIGKEVNLTGAYVRQLIRKYES